MSRLQVGGLALLVDSLINENIGKVVKITGFYGDMFDFKNCWNIEFNEPVRMKNMIGMEIITANGIAPEKWLMPLGDQQTQDELRKEQLKGELCATK